MTEQKRTLTQSRRLGNSRRWGSAYRNGRQGHLEPGVEPPRAAMAAPSTVIELSRHREHARP